VIFETHAHIHDRKYDADRSDVVARARGAGIERIVTVGCDLEDSARALATAEEYGVDWSIGIHPHEAKDAPADLAAAFDAAIGQTIRAPVAVGETGLDYYYGHSPRDAQAAVMRAQVRYARDRGFPVIFHHRDAFDDFIAIMREEWKPGMRGVVHCFTGDAAQARQFTEEFDLLLGIGGVVTFKTAQALRDAVVAAGLERLVVETDCPYLAPVPHRGKRNEPAFIVNTIEVLAQLFGRAPSAVSAATAETAARLFARHL
jgi:TatD DNase family protein